MRHLFLVLFLLYLSFPIEAAVETAPREPWFSTDSNLVTKEPIIEANTWELVTPTGLLVYRGLFPWSDRDRFLLSHNLSDQPAWHGYFMAALAFKDALTWLNYDASMAYLADGLLKYYEVTGVPGLIGRSMIPDYTGPRLPWMEDEKAKPDTFWMQGPKGQWWRNGVAKDHLNLAAFGCAIPLALDRMGKIHLEDTTKQKLIAFLLPLAKRLVKHNFQIIDWNGKRTKFGDLNPQFLNGFNQLLSLHLLRSASFYDKEIEKVYKEKINAWSQTIAHSFQILGSLVSKAEDSQGDFRAKIKKPSFSDMQAIGLAYLSLFFQEKERKHMKYIRRGMSGLWKFMKHERNPMFTIPYVGSIRPEQMRYMDAIIEDLRDFPLEKWAADTGRKVSNQIQPLANRPYDTNYWKSDPFRKIIQPPPPRTGKEQVFPGMDYLLAYWMGRYFNVIPYPQ